MARDAADMRMGELRSLDDIAAAEELDANIKLWAVSKGYDHIAIKRDGNCLFEAVAQSTLPPGDARVLRTIIGHMIKTECVSDPEFSSLIHALEMKSTVEASCTVRSLRMSVNGTYGDDTEVYLLAKNLETPIHLHQISQKTPLIIAEPRIYNPSGSYDPIHLLYYKEGEERGTHYDLLKIRSFPGGGGGAAAGSAGTTALTGLLAPGAAAPATAAEAEAAAAAALAAGGGGSTLSAEAAPGSDESEIAIATALLLEATAAAVEAEKRSVTGVALRPVATPAEAVAASRTIAGMAGSFVAAPFKAVAAAGRSALGGLGGLGARLSTTRAPAAVAAVAAAPLVRPALPETYPPAVKARLLEFEKRRSAKPPPAIDPDSAAITAAALAEKTAVTPGTAILPTASTKGDVVSTYIVWNDHVLIHQRGPMIVFARTISVPGGFVNTGETYTAAALRELKEEAQLVALDVSGLTAFRTLKVPVAGGDKNVIAFVARVTAKPVVGGPEVGHVDEVLNPLDATVLTLSDVDAGHPAYRWVHRETLAKWLAAEGNARYKNDLFATTLVALNKWLPPATVAAAPVPPPAKEVAASLTVEGQIPAWVPPDFFGAADLDASKAEKCRKTSFPTGDCLAAEVRRDIDTADTYKSKYRLTKRSDRMLQRYRDLKKEEEVLQGSSDQSQKTKNKLEKVQRQLEADFYDEEVRVRVHDPKTQTTEVKKFSVPNPYRALAYRDQDPNFRPNFADPAGTGKSVYDPDGKMFAANAAVLKAIAPMEMIADHDMAVALLESLWYCGRNPTVSNDPRCFPLRLMGELREWDANKRQMRDAAAAKVILDRQEWTNMKSWLTALLALTKGNTVYPWIPPPGEPKKVVAPVAAVAAVAAPAAVVPAPVALTKPGVAAPAAGGATRRELPALLGVPIVPLARGAGLVPLIPRPLRLG